MNGPWRQRLRRLWHENKWFVVGGLWVLALALGFAGFSRYYSSIGESHSFWHNFYVSLQLFVFESGDVPGILPWPLEIARFLAPAVTVFTIITAIASVFYERLQRMRLRFIKGHVVICGLGGKGLILGNALKENYPVVIIEQNGDNPMLEQCKGRGTIVLIGNATDPAMLRRAKVAKAGHLVSVCGDDGVNAEVAVNARKLVENRKGSVLNCLVHVYDLQLCNLVREQEMYMSKADNFRLEFFNVFESGARTLLNQFPAYGLTWEEAERTNSHPLVIGMGRMGESVVVNSARRWSHESARDGGRLRISILDRDAERKKETLQIRYPELNGVFELIPLQMDIDSPEYRKGGFLFGSGEREDVTIVYVCLDDDSRALSAALLLLKRLGERRIPIVVRMAGDEGLSNLLRGEMGDCSFSNLHAFGLLDRTCNPDLLFAGINEVLARCIHEEYVRNRKEDGETRAYNAAVVPWEELSGELKESNRQQADHITAKLKAVGCAIAPVTDWGAGLFEFTPDEVELMAEMEHGRWVEERKARNWTCAQGEKNLAKKTSPHLVPWDRLPEEIKDYDRQSVRGIPAFLARAGFCIFRLDSTA